jgi:ABC-2 type transport system permease protein
MFRSIFSKTLFERKNSTIIWTVVFFLYVVLIVALFPALKESLGQALQNVPESMQGLLGNASDYQNINGYIDIQIIGQMIFLTLIMGIIFGTSLLAGDEKSGILHTLLAQPVSRASVYVQKFLALVIITAVTCIIGVFSGIIAGAVVVGELSNVDITRTIQGVLMIWLLTLAFTTLTYVIGAVTGSRGVAGIIAGLYAFGAYMITTLASTANALETLNTVSPFHYFNQPSIMKTGLDTGNIIVLSAATIVLFVIGLIIFRKRNIYSR